VANIGIIGYGIVGKAVAYGFKNNSNIIKFYDKFKESESFEDVVGHAEFIFVCLPTPYKDDKIDLSIMDENIEGIAKLTKDTGKIIILKSTIVPGATRRYKDKYPGCLFCFNPEFLTEENHLSDFVNAARHIISADEESVKRRVTDLYRMRFPDAPVFLTDTTTAEMVKYMANSFLAAKVVFANEMYDLCQKIGISYEEVKKMVVADPRIGKSHFEVTSARGFGGKCFPKDMVALLGLYRELGVDASLLEAVWKKNLKIRKIKDWEEIPFVKS